MPKKTLLLVTLLGLTGQASADKDPDNLKGLKVTDICPIGIQIYVKGARDKAFEDKLISTLKEQDTLFNIGFMNPNNFSSCTQGSYVSFDYFRTAAGSYVYSYDFVLYSRSGTRTLSSDQLPVKGFAYYDISGLGIETSLENLQSTMITVTKELFQGFALDWRKTH